MNFYKDGAGRVFSYEADGSQDHAIPEGQIQITRAEADALRLPRVLLSDAKLSGLARIDAYGKAQRVKIAGTPDEIEIAAWNNKLVIAKAIKAGTASAGDKAAFQAEINARGKGETIDAFTDKVLANASFFAQAVGLIDGLKRHTQDAVNAADTPEAVEAVLAGMKAQAEAAFAQLMKAVP